MATIELTPAVLRALGEGVARLRDGDMHDDMLQKEVVETLEARGYRYDSYNFTHRDRALVVGHLHPAGADRNVLSKEEDRTVRSFADGFGPIGPFHEAFYDWSHVRDSSESAIKEMAGVIREIRTARGLAPDPD